VAVRPLSLVLLWWYDGAAAVIGVTGFVVGGAAIVTGGAGFIIGGAGLVIGGADAGKYRYCIKT